MNKIASNPIPVAMVSLANKSVLVTGATSGIGFGIADLFATSGANVMLTGRDVRRGQEAAKKIGAGGARVEFRAADLKNRAHCDRVVGDTVAAFGGLDVLVNCGAVLHNGTVETLSDAAWDETFAVNVTAVF
ncbi:MAG: SDR family NAD(P)-dependent oxidoreductase, partial [Alphaproteobacteria bacterium]|nr:SDR family NAD(P)-dependent oxidoreductase [Alphaproteobacteria bacterium]